MNGKLRRDVYKDLPDGVRLAVSLGLGRIVALYGLSSTLYQIRNRFGTSLSEVTIRPNR